MCLNVNTKGGRARERGISKASTRRVAYKLITRERRALFRSSYLPRYTYRSVHSGTNLNIIRGRRVNSYGTIHYNAGIHVYTTLRNAQNRRRWLGGMIVRVKVTAADWIASGDRGDAVYSKIKVLGRVK